MALPATTRQPPEVMWARPALRFHRFYYTGASTQADGQLPAGAYLRQPLAEDWRKSSLNLRGDETLFVQILKVGFVFGSKAGELHVHQVRQRDERDSFDPAAGAELGHWLRIFRAHFFAIEDHVHRPSGRRLPFLHQHVNAGRVPVLQPEGLHSRSDSAKIFAPDCDVDVFGQAPGVGLGFLYVEIRGQAADNAVLDAGGTQGLFHSGREIEEILQAFLEEGVDEK
jgi:hypothetical protein